MVEEETSPKKSSIDLGATKQANQAIKCLENGDPKAFKFVTDYFSLIIDKLKFFDFSRDDEVNDDFVLQRVGEMNPLRNEIINLMIAIAKFTESPKFYKEIHSFFENLLPYFSYRNEADSNRPIAAEHYVLFGSQLFIYTVAVLLKFQKFEQLNELTNQGYYIPRWRHNSMREFIPFCRFNKSSQTLVNHYDRKGVSEDYSKANFIKEQLFEEKFNYEELAQADFILNLISLLDIRLDKERIYDIWHLNLHVNSYSFELFVRSESARFFGKFSKCLRFVTKDELKEFFTSLRENKFGTNFYFPNLNWERRISFDKISSRA